MKKTLVQKLGLLGIVSFLSYTAAVERFSVFAATGFNTALGLHLFCAAAAE